MGAEHVWMRYVPGAAAALGSLVLIGTAPKHRKMLSTGIATLLGLVCMEAEYWAAHGFPASEVPFFSSSVVVTLAALLAGGWGCLLLSVAGFGFFTYVNLRYGVPICWTTSCPSSMRRLWHGRGGRCTGMVAAFWPSDAWKARSWPLSWL